MSDLLEVEEWMGELEKVMSVGMTESTKEEVIPGTIGESKKNAVPDHLRKRGGLEEAASQDIARKKIGGGKGKEESPEKRPATLPPQKNSAPFKPNQEKTPHPKDKGKAKAPPQGPPKVPVPDFPQCSLFPQGLGGSNAAADGILGQARQLVEVTIATYVGLDKKPRRPGMSLAELWRKELDEDCGQSDERRMAYARDLVLRVGDGKPPEMIQRISKMSDLLDVEEWMGELEKVLAIADAEAPKEDEVVKAQELKKDMMLDTENRNSPVGKDKAQETFKEETEPRNTILLSQKKTKKKKKRSAQSKTNSTQIVDPKDEGRATNPESDIGPGETPKAVYRAFEPDASERERSRFSEKTRASPSVYTAVSPKEKQDTAQATDKGAPAVAELPTRSKSARSKKEEVDAFLLNLQEALEDFEACNLEACSFDVPLIDDESVLRQIRELAQENVAMYVGLDRLPRSPGVSLAELWRMELEKHAGKSDEKRAAYARQLVHSIKGKEHAKEIRELVDEPGALKILTEYNYQPSDYLGRNRSAEGKRVGVRPTDLVPSRDGIKRWKAPLLLCSLACMSIVIASEGFMTLRFSIPAGSAHRPSLVTCRLAGVVGSFRRVMAQVVELDTALHDVRSPFDD
ncbi:hypothetical protein CVT26_004113 [Gymnopilus dilepis]|uniref:Uncharacterized protein n=1 Tax=Gymnopilus dilepis TaxID=231916 RepID=A0A409YV78_9AGAR|nr:hypothetical protein CVT26_004113 [Gymnopilus dilepis]